MKLRVKLYYMATGYQIAGAFVFALLGKLAYGLLAIVFAMICWYLGEYWVNKKEDEGQDNDI